MKRATYSRDVIWQSALTAIAIALALAWAVIHAREPLQPSDLQIGAQSLHSYAQEGVMLAEQYAQGNLLRPYVENEAQFLSGKVHDIDVMLSGDGATDEIRRLTAQQRTATQELRVALATLATTPSETATAGTLRTLAVRLGELAQQLKDRT